MSSLVLESTAAPRMHFSLMNRDLPVSSAARCQEQLLYGSSRGVCTQFCPLCSLRKNYLL